jgi:hypothetical protein
MSHRESIPVHVEHRRHGFVLALMGVDPGRGEDCGAAGDDGDDLHPAPPLRAPLVPFAFELLDALVCHPRFVLRRVVRENENGPEQDA